MKCLVPVKRVVDFNVNVRVKTDGSGVETEHVKLSLNPFDEIALEEALRKKEAGQISDILAVSIGPSTVQETLRVALARGADRALLIDAPLSLEPINIAKILQLVVQQENPELIILGKQAIDDDCNQTGQMLAALLQWGQATNASAIRLDPEQKSLEVVREIDGGLETLNCRLPAIVTVDLRLNEPRYISLPNVMKSKSKPLISKTLQDLNFELKTHLKVLRIEPPAIRPPGIKVSSVKELLDKLRNEAKVL